MASKDKLYQFIPDVAQTLKPAKMILGGKQKTFNPDGSINEATSIKLNPNAALQYFISENHPDYAEAVEKMKRKIEKRDAKFGKGKPGSIVEIALTRKEERLVKDDEGNDVKQIVEVPNMGSIPDKYVPKTQEQILRQTIANLESKLKGAGDTSELEALRAELASKASEVNDALEASQADGKAKDGQIADLLKEIADQKQKMADK